jgi:hypothetical protein
MIIPFPFANVESFAPHVRNLGFFVWKPIVIQVRLLLSMQKK